jgi:hypothetical protein
MIGTCDCEFTHQKMYEEAANEAAVISQDDIDLFKRSTKPLGIYGSNRRFFD